MVISPIYTLSFILSLLFTTLVFSIALKKRNNSIMDIAYGLTFLFTSLSLSYVALMQKHLPTISLLLLSLIFMWSMRLSYRIYKRNKGKEEDFRYKVWREEWSKKGKLYFIARSYLQIFVLQAFIISLVLLPFTFSLFAQKVTAFTLLGIIIWVIGFFFEAVGDAQLDSFIAQRNKHGKTFLTTGLFAYTRHPNYFGEASMWTGLALASFGSGASVLVFISPFLITFLLLFVSGIPMIEKRWEGIPEWEAYKKKTSAFFPLPTKK